jgi:hypothetical protein
MNAADVMRGTAAPGAAAAGAAGAAAGAAGAAAAAADPLASNIDTATPTKSSHIFPAIHASASGLATVDTVKDGPHNRTLSSAWVMEDSCPNIAKAAAAIKRNLSLAKSDRDTSARRASVKLSVRCFTRTGTSLDCAADWKEDVNLSRHES